jgi:hypothetical protein
LESEKVFENGSSSVLLLEWSVQDGDTVQHASNVGRAWNPKRRR